MTISQRQYLLTWVIEKIASHKNLSQLLLWVRILICLVHEVPHMHAREPIKMVDFTQYWHQLYSCLFSKVLFISKYTQIRSLTAHIMRIILADFISHSNIYSHPFVTKQNSKLAVKVCFDCRMFLYFQPETKFDIASWRVESNWQSNLCCSLWIPGLPLKNQSGLTKDKRIQLPITNFPGK